MQLKKVIISGGGTGGHIFPAVAIANALGELCPGIEILFVGANGKMEMEKVPAAGYKIVGLDVEGFKRKLTLANVKVLWKFWKSTRKAGKIIREFQPQVAVGVGGYASAAMMYKAGKMKVPVLIQEQNSYPGITNKQASKFAQKICVAYPGMEKYFPASKLIITGNPIRQDIENNIHTREEAFMHFNLHPAAPVVLVFGGSQGARAINEGMEKFLPELSTKNYQVIWQTGKPFFERGKAAVEKSGNANVKIMEFIEKMPLAYKAADLVISRAGAISVAEICASGLPAVFVPLPTAAEDHQTKNAKALVEREAGILLTNDKAPEELGRIITTCMEDGELRKKLSHHAKQMEQKNAARRIAEEIIKLAA